MWMSFNKSFDLYWKIAPFNHLFVWWIPAFAMTVGCYPQWRWQSKLSYRSLMPMIPTPLETWSFPGQKPNRVNKPFNASREDALVEVENKVAQQVHNRNKPFGMYENHEHKPHLSCYWISTEQVKASPTFGQTWDSSSGVLSLTSLKIETFWSSALCWTIDMCIIFCFLKEWCIFKLFSDDDNQNLSEYNV